VSKRLSYGDAVRLLGGQDSKIVSALDKVAGGVLLGGAVAGFPAMLSLFGAKAEAARLGHELVRKLSERRGSVSRYSRTQRLEAAHAVLVVTAYLEALEETQLPSWFTDLELTKAERVAMADDDSQLARSTTRLVDMFFSTPIALPEPQLPYEAYLSTLRDHVYVMFSRELLVFVRILGLWDRLIESEKERFEDALGGVVSAACDEYEELFRRLAADFPEVACWANLRDHQATRIEVRNLGIALAALERTLTEISTGSVPDQRRASLTRAYRAELERPIVESGDTPVGLRIPTLGQAYVTPRFRARQLKGGARPSEESWWEEAHVRDDLDDFLIGYLTSPLATGAPLMVLGQPGSGKSVLMRMLAARLPARDFLAVRVVLREVPAEADLQDQIEHAIRRATGERLDWSELVRSAGDALPIVLLDGFDELLQATGVSQTDYLTKIVTFQRREEYQGRPMAVVVTSRISVADRARAPEDMVVMRLEPFDPDRVTAWLKTWNAANVGHFAACGLAPLSPEVVLAHRELAQQPLLLLMLALYDADGNALQRVEVDLPQGELYEQLLRSFARREVDKHRPGLVDRELNRAVGEELRRLSIVAFAMFNRGSQWVAESDLDADLLALLGAPTMASPMPDLRAPLQAAEIVIGRFFFVHRAQASRDDTQLETYEFLHATFGEFLVARLTWHVLLNIAAREDASTMSLGGAPADDDLHALLSFAALSVRAPVVGFLTGMASDLDQAKRGNLAELLVRLFRVVHQPRPDRGYPHYAPRLVPVPARHAAYSANLVLLTVCVAGSVRASELYGTQANAVTLWHSQTLLWRSQLNFEEWTSLVESLALKRLWEDEHRDIRLTLDDRTFYPPPTVDPYWTFNRSPSDPARGWYAFASSSYHPDALRRTANFQCGIVDDVASHALEPLANTLGTTINTFIGWEKDTCPSAAHALLDIWLLPLRNPTAEERRTAYERCAKIAAHDFPPWDETTQGRYTALLIDRLTTDDKAPAALAADVLSELVTIETFRRHEGIAHYIVRCALAFLGHDRDSDERIAKVLFAAVPMLHPTDILAVEVLVRLTELGLPALSDLGNLGDLIDLDEDEWRKYGEWDRELLVSTLQRRRPDLVKRIRWLAEKLAPPDEPHSS
jgi:hypothetical protein